MHPGHSWSQEQLWNHTAGMYALPPLWLEPITPIKKKGKKMKIHWDADERQIKTKNGSCLYDKRDFGYVKERLNQIELRLGGIAQRRKAEDVKLKNTQHTKALYDKNLDRIKINFDRTKGLGTRLDRIEVQLQDYTKKLGVLLRDNRPRENHVDIESLQAQLKCAAKGHGKWVYQRPTTHYSPAKDGGVMKRLSCFVEPDGHDFVFKCSVCNLEITKTQKELSPTEREALKKLKLLQES